MTHDLDWMDDAACGDDQSLPWTSDLPPDPETIDEMAVICSHCPVADPCGRRGLADQLDGGMYAGIWVPMRPRSRGPSTARGTRRWNSARVELRRALRLAS